VLLNEINEYLEGTLIGNGDLEITGIGSFESAKVGDVTFVFDKKYTKEIDNSLASAFITATKLKTDKPQIIVKNPRATLGKVLDIFFPNNLECEGISEKAYMAKDVVLGKDVTLQAFCYIDKNTTIGDNTFIYNHVSIGKNCKIGQNCLIFPHAVLYDNTELGDNVIIHSGTVIGVDGFGYYPEGETWQKIIHIGKTVIKNNVEIQANSSIDRGCLGETVIGNGTKIDNLVHIAHNCQIGDNCAIASLSGISGSVTLEDHVVLAGQVGIVGHVRIGKNSIILAKTGVSKNVAPNMLISGVPGSNHRDNQKNLALMKKIINEYKEKRSIE
jgi:UDP-3-O-[3-hydroxymyristoyl] glucosamine N-acyltransferase